MMFGCEELNYLLLIGLGLSIYMYMLQRSKQKNLDTIEADLIKKAYFDPLTALPNEENINIILEDQIYRCKRREKSFFTAIVKILDPTDEVIIESGLRLFNSIRTEDTVGYSNKGKFIIVFNEYLDKSNLEIILKRIRVSLEILIDIDINTYPDKETLKELTS